MSLICLKPEPPKELDGHKSLPLRLLRQRKMKLLIAGEGVLYISDRLCHKPSCLSSVLLKIAHSHFLKSVTVSLKGLHPPSFAPFPIKMVFNPEY